MSKTRKNVYISEDVERDVLIKMANEGRKNFSALVEELLKEYLEEE